jgi:hypothetical protein
MKQLKGHGFFYKAVMALGVSLLAICVGFFVWKLFLKAPEVTVRYNYDNLTMAQVLEKDKVVLSDGDWKKYGNKFRTKFPYIITVSGGHINTERYHRDFPDNVIATWSSEWESPHAFQFPQISEDTFQKKYVTRW